MEMETLIVNIMIKLVEKKKSKKKHKPAYTLEVKYMIGDANGYTSEEGTFPVECADALERFCKILDKLQPLEGSWGVMLNEMDSHFAEGQITQEDLDFWNLYVERDYDEDELDESALETLELLGTHSYGDGLGDLVRAETEYSFLVYQNYKLTYYDEDNIKHQTYFE